MFNYLNNIILSIIIIGIIIIYHNVKCVLEKIIMYGRKNELPTPVLIFFYFLGFHKNTIF
jgi:hypothetical protein